MANLRPDQIESDGSRYFYQWGLNAETGEWVNFTDNPTTWEIIDDTTIVYHISKFDWFSPTQKQTDRTIKTNANRYIVEVTNTEKSDDQTYSVVTRYTYDDLNRLTKSEEVNGQYNETRTTDYIYGLVKILPTGIDEVEADTALRAETVTVYNLQGICVLRDANRDALTTLPAGIYVINGVKALISK